MNDLLSQTKNNLKQYRRYAMFCLTFTTASSAHLSSNRLKRRVDSDVIAPLAQVLGMFRNILVVIDEHKRLHAQFLKYLQYKATHQMTGASAAAPSGLLRFRALNLLQALTVLPNCLTLFPTILKQLIPLSNIQLRIQFFS